MLTGSRQLYEASGDDIYLDFFMRSMENIVREDGSISMQGMENALREDGSVSMRHQEQKPGDRKIQSIGMGREFIWMYEYSRIEKYKAAVERQIASVKELCRKLSEEDLKDGRLLYLTQPFYMEYETKYHNKAEYKDIVKILSIGGQKQKDALWYLMALADVIGCMSIEIYEHYRFLEENLKRNVRQYIQDRDSLREAGKNDFGTMLGYVILKACSQKNLNPEKYGEIGQELVTERMDALDFVKRKESAGLLMMAYAQLLRFKGGHMPA